MATSLGIVTEYLEVAIVPNEHKTFMLRCGLAPSLFLGKGQWDTDWVSYCLFRILVETVIAGGLEILVVVDDTLNKHRGKEICGAGWQHDGSAPKLVNQKSYGECFVIIGLAIRLFGISDRVFCLPYAARLWWPPRAKVQPLGLPYKKKPQLALDLINLTHSWLEQGSVSESSPTWVPVARPS